MRSSLLALSLLLSTTAFAADTPPPAGDAPADKAKTEAAKPDPDAAVASVEEDAQPKKRSISMRGRSLSYTVTPGHLTIRDDDDAPRASMFYTAYTMESGARPRPVTFIFNGGPGSSTMWLHIGQVRADQGRCFAAGNHSGSAVSLRREPGHVARRQRSRVHRRANHWPFAPGGQSSSPRISSASTRIWTPSAAPSSVICRSTGGGIRPSSLSAKATERPARPACRTCSRTMASSSTASCSCRPCSNFNSLTTATNRWSISCRPTQLTPGITARSPSPNRT